MELQMEVINRQEHAREEVVLEGEIDLANAPVLKEKLQAYVDMHGNSDLYLNLKNLSYIDSTGLGVLVGIYKQHRANGKKVFILEPKDNVRKLFRITNLDVIFDLEGKSE